MKQSPELPKHVQRIRKSLADGTVREYFYDRRTRAALDPKTFRPLEAAPEQEAPEEITFGMLCTAFRASPEYAATAESTKRIYTRCMEMLEDKRNLPLSELKRRNVLGLRDAYSQTPGMANQLVKVVCRMLSFAVDREMIEHNVALRIPTLKMGEWERWTDEALEKALAGMPEKMRRALILGLYTGQRLSDCLALRWSAFDGSGIQVKQQKTGAEIYIPCHPFLRDELARWKAEAVAKGDVVGLTILQTLRGRPWSLFGFEGEWRRARQELGIPFNFHGLRKTAAAKLAEAGCSDREIMAITGHKSASEVERYTRQADQKVRATAAIVKLQKIL